MPTKRALRPFSTTTRAIPCKRHTHKRNNQTQAGIRYVRFSPAPPSSAILVAASKDSVCMVHLCTSVSPDHSLLTVSNVAFITSQFPNLLFNWRMVLKNCECPARAMLSAVDSWLPEEMRWEVCLRLGYSSALACCLWGKWLHVVSGRRTRTSNLTRKMRKVGPALVCRATEPVVFVLVLAYLCACVDPPIL